MMAEQTTPKATGFIHERVPIGETGYVEVRIEGPLLAMTDKERAFVEELLETMYHLWEHQRQEHRAHGGSDGA
jgi:hypothetical protein